MNKLQYKVLYRQFLFRMVDLELLSRAAQGDIHRLLGRFAAILVVAGAWLAFAMLIVGRVPASLEVQIVAAWAMEHFLIATTMLVVGLFTVISWDSMFPDRRDVLVLAPLPVRPKTLFIAKAAAVATTLGLSVVAINAFTGFATSLTYGSLPIVSPPAYDAALPPVMIGELKTVLDLDLIPAMAGNGALAPGTNAGLAIGVLQNGERRIFRYGAAKADSIFELGSISKTFSALILARMVQEGRVRLDEPVRELLPPGTVAKPAGREISLLDLATHHSGLPGIPDNVIADGRPNPAANYQAADLYAFLKRHGVAKPTDAGFEYSNLGFGLLAQALVERSGTSYEDLLRREVTGPLNLQNTAVSLSSEQQMRSMQGYGATGAEVPPVNMGLFAAAGSIRSTAGDMLTYLAAQLHPEQFAPLTAAIEESHRVRADATEGLRVALAWVRVVKDGAYWHNGATGGFSSDVFFQPQGDYAAVVLFNHTPDVFGGFTGQLGEHIRQRLAGQPAVSLANPMQNVRPVGGPIRLLAAYWLTMLATGVFTFCFVLSLQGFAQLLPRQAFLRVSGFLQLGAFALFVSMYFMQLPFASPQNLFSPENQSLLPWLPSYWFFGMFQQLNGSRPGVLDVFIRRAWIGLGCSIAGAIAAYLICYFRTLRKIAEQPDILPSRAGLHWLPRFGGALQTAVAQFSIRTLVRSRRHRVTLAFYLGVAFAIVVFVAKDPSVQTYVKDGGWHQPNPPIVVATFLAMFAAVAGIRVSFSMPLDLRANWVFRIMPLRGGVEHLRAARRSLYALSVVPVWLLSAAALLWLWPWKLAAMHLAVVGLTGTVLAEICLLTFRKIPFTCSYLPGKSSFQVYMAAGAFLGLALGMDAIKSEEVALTQDHQSLLVAIVILAVTAFALRQYSSRHAPVAETIDFEDVPVPTVMTLGLNRDGTPV